MEKGGSSSKPSSSVDNLLCREDKSILNEEDSQKLGTQFIHSQVVPYYNDNEDDDEDEYIQMLVQKETNSLSSDSSSSPNYPPWVNNARSRAINWILNTQNSFGFQNQTAYLSIIYLDRFLSRKYIYEHQTWAAILLSVACVSLAAKMEENKVPALSEYKVDDFDCGSSVIQHMELIVLTTLEWNMNLITPFVYFDYFITHLGFRHIRHDLIPKATDLVMALLKEAKSINDYRPFVVAAAAVIAASDWQLTQEALKFKLSTVSLWDSSDNQQKEQQQKQLFSCYSIMQRLCSKNNPSTPITTEVEQRETASTSKVGSKRKLGFRDSDQNPDLPDDKGLG